MAGLLMLAVAGCAAKAPLGPNGEPLQKLAIVTTSGEHPFWVEIADEEPERQRGLMFRPPL
ncbi:MAG: DUF192 domain-containing protein, partial [Alphaproteobacteria bacterium]